MMKQRCFKVFYFLEGNCDNEYYVLYKCSETEAIKRYYRYGHYDTNNFSSVCITVGRICDNFNPCGDGSYHLYELTSTSNYQ